MILRAAVLATDVRRRLMDKGNKRDVLFSLRIGTTSPIFRDSSPDGSIVGTSGGKRIMSAVVCASRVKRAVKNAVQLYSFPA